MITVQSFTFNPYQENTYVLSDGSGQCVIIDPGMYDGGEENILQRYITDQKLQPVALLNTHCHIDHVLGNRFVADTWGLLPQFHEGELPLLQAVPSYAPAYGMRYQVSPLPETFLPSSGTFSFGNSDLELIFAPGHSPAHLCFYSREDDFLIGGDVLFYQSIGRTDLPGGNHQQLLDSIEHKLFVLPDSCTVYSGHGPSTTIGFEKRHNPFLT